MQEQNCLQNLPTELAYLGPYAVKYRLEGEDDIEQAIETLTEADLQELARVAERVRLNEHYPRVNQFLDKYDIDEYADAAWLYFFFGLLDAADLNFD